MHKESKYELKARDGGKLHIAFSGSLNEDFVFPSKDLYQQFNG